MEKEVKKKANPDYTESAENLVNPQEVIALYHEMQLIQHSLDSLNGKLKAVAGEVLDAIAKETATMGDVRKKLMAAIDQYGSYQDVENGFYALKQRKVSKSYDAKRFEEHYPTFAPAVLVKTVNAAALQGLIKGGLINPVDLQEKYIISESITYAHIIK